MNLRLPQICYVQMVRPNRTAIRIANTKTIPGWHYKRQQQMTHMSQRKTSCQSGNQYWIKTKIEHFCFASPTSYTPLPIYMSSEYNDNVGNKGNTTF